jgi:replicative DNA helicase
MDELTTNLNDVDEKVSALMARAGKLNLVEYPTGTMRPSDLRRLIDMHIAAGIKYDLVVVDYADIMAPDVRSQDGIENSKSIYEGLRAIAQEYNCAVLTATQTNREGFKSSVAKAEHVAEDFNKVRIVDLMISINKTEEEAERNEARLFFAASRNQRGAFTLRIQQNLEAMRFVVKVLGIE